MKRSLAVLLIFMLCVSLLSLPSALAEDAEIETFVSGDYQYTLLEDGTAQITEWIGEDTDLILPSTLDGYSVASIGDFAFDGCSSLAGVSIPDSVTSIGDAAFRLCSSLAGISIPGSVASIGEQAFYGCSSLTSLIIPDGVVRIGDYAFDGCSSLTAMVNRESYAKQYCEAHGIPYTIPYTYFDSLDWLNN